MNDLDRDAYRRRYVKRLSTYGHDERTLGWTSGKQRDRFTALLSFVPLTKVASILDVGCGFGDLFGHLREEGFAGRYMGIDIVPELIEVGRRAYGEAELRVADISELPLGDRFDLVVASGIFNARLQHEDNWDHICTTLKAMYSHSRIATAADFLTSYVDFRRDDLYYASPEDLFRFAKGLTRRVALAHHYLPFEFAVCLFNVDEVGEGARFRD